MTLCEVVDSMRNTDWLPTGDSNQRNIKPTLARVIKRNPICVIIVPPTVRHPIKLSKSPSDVPRSTFHDAILTMALPTTTEKTRGNNVAACA